jgi:SpoVK/Ycf46/Vps4 family AAA+-type ATPase
VLLHGKPGVGKTKLAIALARECGLGVLTLQGATMRGSIVGETEMKIATVFAKARESAPSIILVDQVSRRSK